MDERWLESVKQLNDLLPKFNEVHGRYRKKEGYTKEDQAILDDLRLQARTIGNTRYSLLKNDT